MSGEPFGRSNAPAYTPLVSIVIPVYNGANYLAQAIDSALGQTYPNIEVLVVNDGSSDDGATERVALSYGDKIRYFAQPNGGVSSALNYGIGQMAGEWFSWLSHDDLYMPEKVAREVEVLQDVASRESAVVYCADRLIDKDGKPIFHPDTPLAGTFTGREFFLAFYGSRLNINGCTLLINRSLFARFGGFRPFKYVQDVECWVRFMLHGASFHCIADRLVAMRVHRGQVTVRFPELYYTERSEFGKIVADTLLAEKTANEPLIRCYLSYLYKTGDRITAAYLVRQTGELFPVRKYLYRGMSYAGRFMRWAYRKLIKRAK